MKLKTVKKISSILFLVVGGITVLEFLWVQGMFTAFIMMFLVVVVGLMNIVVALVGRQYLSALHYVLTSIALCMGYVALV